jgi:hypothetical protein
MIQVWCAQKVVLKMLSRGKYAQHGKGAKWPELEADVLKWVEGHCQLALELQQK